MSAAHGEQEHLRLWELDGYRGEKELDWFCLSPTVWENIVEKNDLVILSRLLCESNPKAAVFFSFRSFFIPRPEICP